MPQLLNQLLVSALITQPLRHGQSPPPSPVTVYCLVLFLYPLPLLFPLVLLLKFLSDFRAEEILFLETTMANTSLFDFFNTDVILLLVR